MKESRKMVSSFILLCEFHHVETSEVQERDSAALKTGDAKRNQNSNLGKTGRAGTSTFKVNRAKEDCQYVQSYFFPDLLSLRHLKGSIHSTTKSSISQGLAARDRLVSSQHNILSQSLSTLLHHPPINSTYATTQPSQPA
jgi:hypothetical protein